MPHRREFRLRQVLVPGAVFATIATMPWIVSSIDSRGPIAQAPLLKERAESHASAKTSEFRTDTSEAKAVATAGADVHASLEIIEGRIRNRGGTAAQPQVSAVDDHATINIVGGKIANPGNTAGTVPGAVTPLEPHAILEIRQGSIYREHKVQFPYTARAGG
jgi:hypothetical protein